MIVLNPLLPRRGSKMGLAKTVFSSLAIMVFSSAAFAGICDFSLRESANENVSQTTPFPPLHQAFPYGRGLIDTSVPVTPENTLKAKSLGLNEWGIRIYPVSSLEEALKHYNKGEYYEISMQTFYLLLPKGASWKSMSDEDRTKYEALSTEEQRQIGTWEYQKLIQQGAKLVYLHRDQISRQRIEKRLAELKETAAKDEKKRDALGKFITVFEDFLKTAGKKESYQYKTLPIDIVNNLPGDTSQDQWTDVPADTAKKMTNLEISLLIKDEGDLFYQMGWFAPEVHGVIVVDDFTSRSTAKDLRKFIKSLFNKGYRITFNQNPRMVIEEAGDQVRGQKETKGASRFKEETIRTYEELIKAGKAYSIEIWHPTGILVGGTFGFISNGVVGGESVFYPNPKDPDLLKLKELFKNDPRFAAYSSDPVLSKSIDFAKVAVLTLMDALKANGIDFMDAGMVTPFTKSMSGKYIWKEDFERLMGKAASASADKEFSLPAAQGAAPTAEFTPMKIKDFIAKHAQK